MTFERELRELLDKYAYSGDLPKGYDLIIMKELVKFRKEVMNSGKELPKRRTQRGEFEIQEPLRHCHRCSRETEEL